MKILLILALVCVGLGANLNNSCTNSCDLNNASGADIVFCGTDMQTHSTKFGAIDDYCYDICGVMTYYEGQCGCPNNCFNDINQGVCKDSACSCSVGWTGLDCSQPTEKNTCSTHGKLVFVTDSSSSFPFSYCDCDSGWTGIDCSSAVFGGNNAPWGTIFNVQPYTESDDYKDNHPLWNISVLATLRIEINDNDYLNLLQPWNLYNESYASAILHFDNGVHKESLKNVGIRIKGAYSRMDMKKGWVIKFNEFVSGQKLFGVKKIGLKSGSVNDDTLVKTKLYADFYRAVGAPVQRSSYALLYINSVYVGIYYMHEDMAPEFIQSRIANDKGNGNFMKYFWNVHLGYFGSDLTYYKEKAHVNQMGVPMHYYEQSDGNGDWTDFLDWLYFFNTTSGSSFEDQVESRVDISSLFRGMVVESFMLASDNFASGANYFTYHLTPDKTDNNNSSSSNNKWMLFDSDFDECFVFDPVTKEPDRDPNIFTFFTTTEQDSYDDRCPMINNLFAIPRYLNDYVGTYKHFVSTVFASQSAVQPAARYADLMQFILPWVTRDKLWQMSFGISWQEFVIDAEMSINNLAVRQKDVLAQIDAFYSAKKN